MMDDDSKFWLRIWGLAAMVLICLIASCTISGYDRRDKWEKAVANGADPMVVSCALLTQGQVEAAACTLLAQNRK